MKNNLFAGGNYLNRSLKTQVTTHVADNGGGRFKLSNKIKKLLLILVVQFAFLHNSFALITGATSIDPDINTHYYFYSSTDPVDFTQPVNWSISGPATIVSQTAAGCVIAANHTDISSCNIVLTVSYRYFLSDYVTTVSGSESYVISRYPFTTGSQTVYPGEYFTYTAQDPCNAPFICSYDWSLTTGNTNTSAVAAWHLNGASVLWPSVVPASTNVSGIVGHVKCIMSCDAGSYVFYTSDYVIHMALRAPTITGASSTPCGATTALTYTANCTGATVYSWAVPIGWTILSYPTYNTITVKPSGAAGGTISATAYAAAGSAVYSSPGAKSVALQQITSVAGSNAVCINTTSTYTAVSTPAGLTGNYTWTTNTAGWLINGLPSPVTTTANTVTVSAPATHGTTNLCVSTSAYCAPVCYTLSSALLATPTYVATNATSACIGTVVTWRINAVPYASSYTWSTSSAGASLSPYGTSCDIFVNGPSTLTKTIQVKANNACGSSAVRTQGLAVKITGPCAPRLVLNEGADVVNGLNETEKLAATNDNLTTENKISIYPNPAATKLWIDISSVEAANYTISVYDMLGSLMLTTKKVTEAGANNASIDVSAFTNGFYFVTIDNGIDIRKEKIIINHE